MKASSLPQTVRQRQKLSKVINLTRPNGPPEAEDFTPNGKRASARSGVRVMTNRNIPRQLRLPGPHLNEDPLIRKIRLIQVTIGDFHEWLNCERGAGVAL